MARATFLDIRSLKLTDEDENTTNGSDWDSESTQSDGGLEEILEDMKCFMESMIDLVSSLENPAVPHVTKEEAIIDPADELSEILEFARPFAKLIRERFTSMDLQLIKKLSEANWNRREQLAQKRAAAIERSKYLPTEEANLTTEVESSYQQPPSTDAASAFIQPTLYSSTMNTSMFDESSIFDYANAGVVSMKRAPAPQSVTSFATSLGDDSSSGRRRVPELPSTYEFGTPYECQFCGDELEVVKHRADWRYVDFELHCLSLELKCVL